MRRAAAALAALCLVSGCRRPSRDAATWATRFGGGVEASATTIAMDAHDAAYVAGAFEGRLDVGGVPLEGPFGARETWVAKLAPDGRTAWARSLAPALDAHMSREPIAIAVDGAGRAAVVGLVTTFDPFVVGADTRQPRDGFVVALDAGGAPRWGRLFVGPGDQTVVGVAFDRAGSLVVAGSFELGMEVAGAPLVSRGAVDGWVAKLDAEGRPLWIRAFGDAETQAVLGVAVGPSDEIALVGAARGTVDFGCGPLVMRGQDAFVAVLDAAGRCRFARAFGDGLAQTAHAVAVDAAGQVTVLGSYDGGIDFGGGALVEQRGEQGTFVVRLDRDGGHVFTTHIASHGAHVTRALAVGKAGETVVAGSFFGRIAFDRAGLVSAGQSDVFVAKLDPAGHALWSRRYGGRAPEQGQAVAIGGGGAPLVTGFFESELDLGPVLVGAPFAREAFVASLPP